MFFLVRPWSLAGAYVAIMLLYHMFRGPLKRWSERMDNSNEAGQMLLQSLRVLLLYATVTTTALIFFKLLGIFEPFQRIMSFPVLEIGGRPFSLWVFLEAGLTLFAFIYISRLLQAYLEYKVYPALGIEPGPAYALNTFLKYFVLVVGILFSLKVVGLDLRVLMVFAGAVGIGVGLGLQNIAANVISGFSIIFGGKLRRGDWIQAGDTRGAVTDIYLRATKVRSRDNIEYLIPNSNFISNTMVNYTLSSPMIRMHIPVGVSYASDPLEVKKILLQCAEKHAEVLQYKKPAVRFTGYGDSSINFDLLVWIDIRNIAEQDVRSGLYFTIFSELKKAGIEIPFPQRDIHIRSKVE